MSSISYVPLLNVLSISSTDDSFSKDCFSYTVGGVYPEILNSPVSTIINESGDNYAVLVGFNDSINMETRRTFMDSTSIIEFHVMLCDCIRVGGGFIGCN